ncbi:MAG: penicillin-binding transpeptidase domain-containing protein [Actinomycetota bacterium]|nr:penicillin-binding transpeptidase domain-containing protein [Actinomycetota bacterium]
MSAQKRSAPRRARRGEPRLLFFLSLLIIGLLCVVVRLLSVQVVEAKRYQALANSQRLRRVEIAPHRGTIYDRQGKELAFSVDAETIYATPYFIKNPALVASKLSPILELDEASLFEKLTKDSGFAYIARKVDKERAEAVRALEIEGISFLKEGKRCYPYNSLGSHVIGFVGMDGRGLAGLELYYDEFLRGEPGQLVAENDPLGRPIPGGVSRLTPSTDGDGVILTIDRDIQYRAEEELRLQVERFQAKGGSIIVMNPRTGEIYAMANEPAFDLNGFSKASAESLRNRAVTDVYEPGSTMKVIIASTALEEKMHRPDDVFHLPSTIKVADKVIGEAHPRPPEDFTFAEIVAKSSNVGAITIGLELGKERMYKYIEAFGLTKRTGIDFPGETYGFTPPPDRWSGSTIGNIPFGQGISATPLQMIQAFSVLANDGFWVRPHLLCRVINARGEAVKTYPEDRGRKVISTQTAREIRDILEQAVNEGTGEAARIDGYRVAGKTGTAQKPKEEGGGYEPGRHIASFVGFAPAQDPQLVILVVIDEPVGAMYGGVVAAPVFKKVAEFSLRHFRIPPE